MYSIEHVHSTFSLHDSGQSPLELVLKAKELGVTNVALTDHGTHFYTGMFKGILKGV